MHYFHTKTSKIFSGEGAPPPQTHPHWGVGHPLPRPLPSAPQFHAFDMASTHLLSLLRPLNISSNDAPEYTTHKELQDNDIINCLSL